MKTKIIIESWTYWQTRVVKLERLEEGELMAADGRGTLITPVHFLFVLGGELLSRNCVRILNILTTLHTLTIIILILFKAAN